MERFLLVGVCVFHKGGCKAVCLIADAVLRQKMDAARSVRFLSVLRPNCYVLRALVLIAELDVNSAINKLTLLVSVATL